MVDRPASSMPPPRVKVLFVDDNSYESYPYRLSIEDEGFEITFANSPEEAIKAVQGEEFSAVVLDVMMDPGEALGTMETKGGFETGVALARKIRKVSPHAKLVALTASESPTVREFFSRDDSVAYFHRTTPPVTFAESLRSFVGGRKRPPKIFIVHGHDHGVVFELKSFLQNRLGLKEPVLLFERPSRGRTILEKFEYYANGVDLAFVIATPDDIGRPEGVPDDQNRLRARQNVIFELGYFLGYLRRATGRVILLHKGPLELPSDVHGLVYVDISDGIERAAEDIRREVSEWL